MLAGGALCARGEGCVCPVCAHRAVCRVDTHTQTHTHTHKHTQSVAQQDFLGMSGGDRAGYVCMCVHSGGVRPGQKQPRSVRHAQGERSEGDGGAGPRLSLGGTSGLVLEGTFCSTAPLPSELFLPQWLPLGDTAWVPLPRHRCWAGLCVRASGLRLLPSSGQAVGGGERLGWGGVGGGGGAGNTWRNVVEGASPDCLI